jgi:hypothetical protein
MDAPVAVVLPLWSVYLGGYLSSDHIDQSSVFYLGYPTELSFSQWEPLRRSYLKAKLLFLHKTRKPLIFLTYSEAEELQTSAALNARPP